MSFGLWAALVLDFSAAVEQVRAVDNIDPVHDGSRYAFGENVGWLSAEPSGDGGPGVKVGDAALAGYLWSENVGWVSLSCANTGSCATVHYGVANNGGGVLSGYAWGENVGWVNFAPSGGGVTIDPATGVFSGRAWGENIGWITFGSTGPIAYQVRAGCPDADGDGIPLQTFLCPAGGPRDCNDSDSQIWGTPGEVQNVLFSAAGQTLSWSAPNPIGGTSVRYDTIRSSNKVNFVSSGICVESDDPSDTMATDVARPTLGSVLYYLVRAENSCPSGQGSLGQRSDGTPRTALNCP